MNIQELKDCQYKVSTITCTPSRHNGLDSVEIIMFEDCGNSGQCDSNGNITFVSSSKLAKVIQEIEEVKSDFIDFPSGQIVNIQD